MKELPTQPKRRASVVAISALLLSASLASIYVSASDYSEGQKQLDQRNWLQAEKTFRKVASEKGNKQDAAFYWLAYAQAKNNQSENALETLSNLKRKFPKSQWIDDANALRAEINDKQGNSDEVSSDEMKLYAIDSLMQNSSKRAPEILEKIIKGNNSDQVKQRAMFVLSQSGDARSYELMSELASDDKNPIVQMYAVEVLGISGSDESMKLLAKIYQSSKQTAVKEKIIESFMVANKHDFLMKLAKEEKDLQLKERVVEMLGVMGQSSKLLEFYNDSSFESLKKVIIGSIAIGGGIEQMLAIINDEKDTVLIVEAVKTLGITSAKKSGKVLAEIYKEQSSREIKLAVIEAMFMQSNASGLIQIIKTEKDNDLKRKVLQSLSMIDSDEVIEFFNKSLN